MLNFISFLAEQAEKLTHLTHPEDLLFSGDGHTAIQALKSVHEKINGAENTTAVSTKFDGSPSLVYGRHPKTGKFFVATKSAFNVTPKINYTEEDIDRNHGHAPGLASKLKIALQHLPKITPKKGVFQGDIMHSEDDLKSEQGKVSFTPNTITYKVPAQSNIGKAAAASKIGLVTHTQYHGGDIADMKATPLSPSVKFIQHGDVNHISAAIDFSKISHTPETKQKFEDHIKQASSMLESQSQDFHTAIQMHKQHLEPYINDTVRTGSKPTVEGYQKFLRQKGQKEIDSVKTDKAKQTKQAALDGRLEHVQNNREHFETAFTIHHHIQQAKNALVDSLSKGSQFEHKIGDQDTKPEGFVATHNGNMIKLVDREEFSRQNLLAGQFRRQKEQ